MYLEVHLSSVESCGGISKNETALGVGIVCVSF